ncbi:MAG: ATP-dependent helicase HrpB [Phycisphaerae bacterium]
METCTLHTMNVLPIDAFLPEIVSLLQQRRSLVLTAQPGAGKTTRVPPALVEAGILAPHAPQTLVLQPRRIAARAVAARIAEERGWQLGRQVGYQVRMERRLTAQTALRIMTEGILARQLLDDPALENVGAVILDEFHERSIHSDLTLAMLRQVRQTIRPDLFILVMSATLDAQKVADFLDNAPVLNVPGRLFPVRTMYRPGIDGRLEDRVIAAVREALEAENTGHILVFLPGVAEISRCAAAAGSLSVAGQCRVLTLHGSMPLDMQVAVLKPSAQRKMIFSTNIAETSLTIDGVTVVIDSGLMRQASFDAQRGLDRLDLIQISQASAQQRAGRAGRTAPGLCFRLWPELQTKHLADFEVPEIMRVDLAQSVLTLYAWDRHGPREFEFFETPPAERLDAAVELLRELGALEPIADGLRLTDVGRKLLELPLHPRLGRLLLAAMESGHGALGTIIAALISERDILVPRRNQAMAGVGESDIVFRILALAGTENAMETHGAVLDSSGIHRVRTVADELGRVVGAVSDVATVARHVDPAVIGELLLRAYPDRVCHRRENDSTRAVMVGGRGVRMGPGSAVLRAPLFVAMDIQASNKPGDALVHLASAITQMQLQQMYPDAIREEKTVEITDGRILAYRKILYRDLVLEQHVDSDPDWEQIQKVAAGYIAAHLPEFMQRDVQMRRLCGRLAMLRKAMPEKNVPKLQAEDISSLFSTGALDHESLRKIITGDGLVTVIEASLDHAIKRLLASAAPQQMEMPNGRQLALEYRDDGTAVLSVRLQDLFGFKDTPRIADGRVPVLLEILGPSQRPVQITDDLAGFWAGSYALVRKDLRARYPKHAWPENPANALPLVRRSRK